MYCTLHAGGGACHDHRGSTPSLHKQSTRKLHRMAVLMYHQGRVYRRLYGRVRRGPLRWMRDPTLILTLTLYPGPHAAARLDPPLKPLGISFKKQRNG